MEPSMQSIKYFVGIDVAASSLAATILSSTDSPGLLKTDIPNSVDGFEALLEWLTDNHLTADNSVLCIEATGVYGEALCYFSAAKKLRIAVEPPLKVKRAFKQAGHKTDAVDSRQIAEYALRFSDELHFWQPNASLVEQIDVLLKTRQHFSVQLTSNQNTLNTLKRKYIQTPVANKVYEKTIQQLKEHIHTIDEQLRRLIDQDPTFRDMISKLTSIPGVGMLMASNILVLSRGFTKTLSHKQLAAHIGICPYQHQSGSSVFKRPRSRRYGPSLPRKLLYLASLSVRTHHLSFEKYFLRKVAEGKSKRLVLNNIANKLLKIICAVVKTRCYFIPNYQSVNPLLLKNRLTMS